MENRLAKGISYAFHPLLIPGYILLLLMNIISPNSLMVPVSYKLILLGIVLLTTFLLPLFLTYLLLRLQLISSFFLYRKEDRVYMILAVSIFYYLTYYLLKGVHLSVIFSYFMLGSTILAVLSLVINFYFRISLHMIGIGSITGLFLGLSLKYGINFNGVLFASIFTAGMIGYARLKLNAHNPAEIYSGYFTGALIMTFLVILL
ncbi:MAG: hypothetical protein M0Q38_06275 [Bacteroidales bacterium]|jgi:hypothetical protein|nr:hypothetical protein [Bacteroidales bacterium]